MIVADASGLVSLGSIEALGVLIEAHTVHTTGAAMDAIEAESGRHGPAGEGARATLAGREDLVVTEPESEPVVTSRLDAVAGGCVILTRELDAPFLLTDDLRAIHEVRRLVPGDVLTPPIALRALVRRGALTGQDARFRLDALARRRRGFEAAIDERGWELLDGDAP